MKQLAIVNPFNAPVYHKETVDSTMNVSRMLAARGEPHGTVITADFQEAGRGRIEGRAWDMERGTNLPFTILLRFPGIEHIPQALTLRTGLAVSLAIEDFVPALCGKVKIKWPNDILLEQGPAKKAAGILVQADGAAVHIGIGVNVAQKSFSGVLQHKAASISLAAGVDISGEERYTLLEKILERLYAEIASAAETNWRERIEARLYQKGAQVSFTQGAADSGKTINGTLSGIGPGGEILITPLGGETLAFTTGELRF